MYPNNVPRQISPVEFQEAFSTAMQRVYLWMALGLAVTAVVSVFIAGSEVLLSLIFNSPLWIGLFIGEIILVVAITPLTMRMSPTIGLIAFFVYAAINGLTLSAIFIVYELGTISLAFSTTALLFGIMSVLGYTTKQDLSHWRNFLLMGLVGLIIATIGNIFLANSTLDWIITYVGIGLFLALTVYDTQQIKNMTLHSLVQGDSLLASRIGVMGALRLYLDFINLFLYILRLFGRRR